MIQLQLKLSNTTSIFEGTPLSDCVPITVDFKETSPDLNIVSWLWMFEMEAVLQFKIQYIHSIKLELLMFHYYLKMNLVAKFIKVNDYVVTWPQPIADFILILFR